MIQIGTGQTIVKSVGHADNYNYDFDDRQQIVKTVNGAVAIDPWNDSRVADGDVISFTALFTVADAETVKSWWASRTKRNVTLDDGSTISGARIVVRGIEYVSLYYGKYVRLKLEVWRV